MTQVPGDQALPGAATDDLAASLLELRAADNPAAPDPEISYLVSVGEWLSADPASYWRWIEQLGRARLRSDRSSAESPRSSAERRSRSASRTSPSSRSLRGATFRPPRWLP
jgi:hypothetical protein